MISARARQGIEQVFTHALGSALAAPGETACRVQAKAAGESAPYEKVVLLTISSYGFRLLTLLHFTLDAATRAHLARIGHAEEGLDDDAAQDVIAECGNICCGALNRALGSWFPHTGMSTPNVLHGSSADFLPVLGAVYLQHFEARAEGGACFAASLCLCAEIDIDFALPSPEVAAETAEATGELEMF